MCFSVNGIMCVRFSHKRFKLLSSPSVCACVRVTFVCMCVYSQAKSERNYHIFYEMLAGLPPHEKHSLYLQEAETYYYLNQVLRFKHADLHQISKKITRTLTSCRVTISITATSVSLKPLSLGTKIQ